MTVVEIGMKKMKKFLSVALPASLILGMLCFVLVSCGDGGISVKRAEIAAEKQAAEEEHQASKKELEEMEARNRKKEQRSKQEKLLV